MDPRGVTGLKARPIFVSSTFKDFQAERDHLRDFVFPALEEFLLDRRHLLEPLDLRQGVAVSQAANEAERELRILKVCLSEIDRSRPFLVVLLGDRYGWVPPVERVRAAASEAGFAGDVTGMSVTALEIEFGIMPKDPGQRRRTYFYFRRALPYDDMAPDVASRYDDRRAVLPDGATPDPEGPARHAVLQALKRRLADDPAWAGHVREYDVAWDGARGQVTGLEGFGRQVLADLRDALAQEIATVPAIPSTWEEDERQQLQDFVALRLRNGGHFGRDGLVRRLLEEARSSGADPADIGTCVTGEPGSGKSALFAHLHGLLSKEEGVLLLANAAGITPRSSSAASMLRRWIAELSASLGEAPPIRDSSPDDLLAAAFGSLLWRAASHRRVVLLVDALDQFDATPADRGMSWLPRVWPAQARFLATALPGPQTDALRDRVRIEPIPPLEDRDVRGLLAGVAARHHADLPEAVVEVLLGRRRDDGSPSCETALWALMAAEAMCLLDADDFARAERAYPESRDRLRHLRTDMAATIPPDVEGLYDHMLAGTEKAYGTEPARAFAAVLAASRAGLREVDLRALVPAVAAILFPDRPTAPLDDLALATLRRGFRAHLVRRGAAGRWDFFHRQARTAVERRIRSAARDGSPTPDDSTQRQVHASIADHLLLRREGDPLREQEAMYHLVAAGDRVRAARFYAGARGDSAVDAATRCLVAHVARGTEERKWTCRLLDALPEPDALADLAERFVFDLAPAVANAVDLPACLLVLRAARDAYASLPASDRRDNGIGRSLQYECQLLGSSGDGDGALRAAQASLDVSRGLHGRDPQDPWKSRLLAEAHLEVGRRKRECGDLEGSARSLDAARRVAGVAAHDDVRTLLSMEETQLALSRRDLGRALRSARATVASCRAALSAHADDTRRRRLLLVSLNQLGHAARTAGELHEATAATREAVSICRDRAHESPQDRTLQYELVQNLQTLAEQLITAAEGAAGDAAPEEAEACYRQSLQIAERLAQADGTQAEWAYAAAHACKALGDLATLAGDDADALRHLGQALKRLTDLSERAPDFRMARHEAAGTMHAILQILLRSDMADQAMDWALRAHRVLEELVAEAPTVMAYQQDLGVSHFLLARCLSAQGRFAEAGLQGVRARDHLRARRDRLASDGLRLLQSLERETGGISVEDLLGESDPPGAAP